MDLGAVLVDVDAVDAVGLVGRDGEALGWDDGVGDYHAGKEDDDGGGVTHDVGGGQLELRGKRALVGDEVSFVGAEERCLRRWLMVVSLFLESKGTG